MARPCFRGAVVLVVLVLPALAWAQGPNPNLNARVAALEAAVAHLQNAVTALQRTVSTQAKQIDVLHKGVQGIQNSDAMKLNQYLTVTTDVEQNLPLIRFTSVNLQLVNGEGPIQVDEPDGLNYYDNPILNKLGNLIIGYNETGEVLHGDLEVRTGSHNLVVGPGHTYSSYGGVVAGFMNGATGAYATVTGGSENTASGPVSSVSGGVNNVASGTYSAVSGGQANTAAGGSSWAAGSYHTP